MFHKMRGARNVGGGGGGGSGGGSGGGGGDDGGRAWGCFQKGRYQLFSNYYPFICYRSGFFSFVYTILSVFSVFHGDFIVFDP